ncbi:hypothetical protein RRF57_002358 [Xylaria bambusicola]|uniref:Aromatic amino acid beta-eliminating lyase/threonine aldolase domain-containing protein n=1 Tax=Xylaria bambusicola TaxID=326684 RepID=A0AAN7UEF7_9PEZI
MPGLSRFRSRLFKEIIPEIIQEMFSYVDDFTIGLKKGGLANMGGFIFSRHIRPAVRGNWASHKRATDSML